MARKHRIRKLNSLFLKHIHKDTLSVYNIVLGMLYHERLERHELDDFATRLERIYERLELMYGDGTIAGNIMYELEHISHIEDNIGDAFLVGVMCSLDRGITMSMLKRIHNKIGEVHNRKRHRKNAEHSSECVSMAIEMYKIHKALSRRFPS